MIYAVNSTVRSVATQSTSDGVLTSGVQLVDLESA